MWGETALDWLCFEDLCYFWQCVFLWGEMHAWAQYPQSSEGDIKPPGAGVTSGHEPPNKGSRIKLESATEAASTLNHLAISPAPNLSFLVPLVSSCSHWQKWMLMNKLKSKPRLEHVQCGTKYVRNTPIIKHFAKLKNNLSLKTIFKNQQNSIY